MKKTVAKKKTIPQNTIVTACNSQYFWGVFLLVSSLRYHQNKDPIHILTQNITEKQKKLLKQFTNIKIIRTNGFLHNSLTTKKPEIILTAKSKYITWLDSDCFITGNINKYLKALDNHIQIRARNQKDNHQLFKTRYQKTDTLGSIPKKILTIWQHDVQSLTKPNIKTAVSACVFVINKKQFPFIRRWQKQMTQVLPKNTKLVEKKNLAYFQTDNSVLNSLLAFLRTAPKISKYQLDQNPQAYVAHFYFNPKPWQMWLYEHLPEYPKVIQLLTWLKKEGYQTPPLPFSFKKHYKPLIILLAYANHCFRKLKQFIFSNMRIRKLFFKKF